tara:strand:- start:6279 stop:7040 length:762 start_codon:yes stop_codon:yes gene_type:complete
MEFKLKKTETKSSKPNKTIHIKDKLEEIGIQIDRDISLGDFDSIGEYTAKRTRTRGSELYKSVGCFYRPNYERGILIYSLIKKYNVKSFLEIGFGRGYSTFCAALAMMENGGGKIVTIDPSIDEEYLKQLTKVFPPEWFNMIEFIKNRSEVTLPQIDETFDLIYIDGDHTYEGVQKDWEGTKDKFNKFLLFDDYHLPSKGHHDIDCARLIDQIEDETKELIIMDRRIFLDDRGYSDKDIDYGQVLLTRHENLH